MNPLFAHLFLMFGRNTRNTPVRLYPKTNTYWERNYETIMGVLFTLLIILVILLIIAAFMYIIIHGAQITGTEANIYYNGVKA